MKAARSRRESYRNSGFVAMADTRAGWSEVGYRRGGGDASIGGKSEGVEISQPRL